MKKVLSIGIMAVLCIIAGTAVIRKVFRAFRKAAVGC
jgi:hypothetical protein